ARAEILGPRAGVLLVRSLAGCGRRSQLSSAAPLHRRQPDLPSYLTRRAPPDTTTGTADSDPIQGRGAPTLRMIRRVAAPSRDGACQEIPDTRLLLLTIVLISFAGCLGVGSVRRKAQLSVVSPRGPCHTPERDPFPGSRPPRPAPRPPARPDQRGSAQH